MRKLLQSLLLVDYEVPKLMRSTGLNMFIWILYVYYYIVKLLLV
jgi:hypothetical protein